MFSFLSIISNVIRCRNLGDCEMTCIDTDSITLKQAKTILKVFEHELASYPSFFNLGYNYSDDSVIKGKISFLKHEIFE